MASKLDWLMADEEFEPAFKMTDGGGFGNGKLGEWTFGALWKVSADKAINMEQLGIEYDGKQEFPNGVNYYWVMDNEEKAKEAVKQIGNEKKKYAERVLHFQMPTSTWLNWGSKEKSASQTFGEKVEFDIPFVGWGSQKYTALQLIVLPSMIQAIALKYKLIDKPVYDYADLPLEKGKENKLDITAEIEKYYLDPENGRLIKARKELWAALGEEDWQAWLLEGPKFVAKNPTMRKLLRPFYRPNGAEMWMKMATVYDPRSSAKTEGNQWKTYVCLDFFLDEDEARASVGGESLDDGLPPIPEGWRGMKKSDFIEQIEAFLSENKLGKLPRPALNKKLQGMDLATNLASNFEELQPWLDVVLNAN